MRIPIDVGAGLLVELDGIASKKYEYDSNSQRTDRQAVDVRTGLPLWSVAVTVIDERDFSSRMSWRVNVPSVVDPTAGIKMDVAHPRIELVEPEFNAYNEKNYNLYSTGIKALVSAPQVSMTPRKDKGGE